MGVALAAIGLSARSEVQASNGVHPRTPVLWTDAPCIQSVDRSVDPGFAFVYTIPFEDTALTLDELEDSRGHQFIALCRQFVAGQPPPPYVSTADLERAVEAGLETQDRLGDPESTLETSPLWAGCWERVTPDDTRRPITFLAAEEPVLWDTSEVSPGTWMIAGYTWEPPLNLWRRAPWVVRVLDEAAPLPPESAQAAASVVGTPQALWSNEALSLETCVEAAPGAVVHLDWRSSKAEPADWIEAGSVVVEEGVEPVLPEFVAPPQSWGLTLSLRVRVDQFGDEPGVDYIAHALSPVVVIEYSEEDDDEGAENGGEDGEEDAGATDTQGASGGSGDELGEDDTSGTGADSGASDSGGHCSLAPERGKLGGVGLTLIGWLAWRRRDRTTE